MIFTCPVCETDAPVLNPFESGPLSSCACGRFQIAHTQSALLTFRFSVSWPVGWAAILWNGERLGLRTRKATHSLDSWAPDQKEMLLDALIVRARIQHIMAL